MTAAAWIGLASLAVAVLVQFGAWVYSFATQAEKARQMADRIGKLENAPKDDCAAQLAAMNATLVEMKERMNRFDDGMTSQIAELRAQVSAAMKHGAPAPRRRAA